MAVNLTHSGNNHSHERLSHCELKDDWSCSTHVTATTATWRPHLHDDAIFLSAHGSHAFQLQEPGHMEAMHRGHLFAAFMCVPYQKIMLYHTPTCTLGGRNRTRQCAPCSVEDVLRRLCSGASHPMAGDFDLVRAVDCASRYI